MWHFKTFVFCSQLVHNLFICYVNILNYNFEIWTETFCIVHLYNDIESKFTPTLVTPVESFHKSRSDNVVRMWVQLKR